MPHKDVECHMNGKHIVDVYSALLHCLWSSFAKHVLCAGGGCFVERPSTVFSEIVAQVELRTKAVEY